MEKRLLLYSFQESISTTLTRPERRCIYSAWSLIRAGATPRRGRYRGKTTDYEKCLGFFRALTDIAEAGFEAGVANGGKSRGADGGEDEAKSLWKLRKTQHRERNSRPLPTLLRKFRAQASDVTTATISSFVIRWKYNGTQSLAALTLLHFICQSATRRRVACFSNNW